MVLITIVTGAYKPTYNWGGLTLQDSGHPRYVLFPVLCQCPDQSYQKIMKFTWDRFAHCYEKNLPAGKQIQLLNMAIEIVSFPIKHDDFPQLFVCLPEGITQKTVCFPDEDHIYIYMCQNMLCSGKFSLKSTTCQVSLRSAMAFGQHRMEGG